MSQHKYIPRQMLFVKNVPQDSAMRIADLYTQYKPLETKNLYPNSRITTLMVALPNLGATEEALRHTDGLKIGNTVITVERYNAGQSMVARRDSRKKLDNVNGHRTYAYGSKHDDFNEYHADGEVQLETETSNIAENVASQVIGSPVTLSRKISKDGGVSWANVASGVPAEQHSPPSAPPVEEHNEQPPLTKESCLLFGSDIWDTRPSENGTGSSTAHSRPMKGTFTSPVAIPLRRAQAPKAIHPNRSPLIVSTPATAVLGPPPALPQVPSSMMSHALSHTAQEGSTLAQATRTQDGESSRVEEEISQKLQVPDVAQHQRGSLAMSINTDQYIQERHYGNCSLCQMRLRRRE